MIEPYTVKETTMFRISFLAMLTLLWTSISKADDPQGLSPKQYQQTIDEVRPGVFEDAYALIPWQTSLWDARELAAKEGKPILLWEMDGHPLGCG